MGSVDVQDDVVYMSGDIHWVVDGGEMTAIVAARESDASLVPVEYHVHGDSPSAGELLVTDDVVIAGGVTATREGARHGLAAYDRATGELLPWFEDVWWSPRTFAVSGRTVYVNGITKVGDEPRNGLAAFDLETGEFLPWAPPGPRGSVQELEAAGGQVAAVGGFRTVTAVQRRDLAAIDLQTNQVTAFDARMALWYECCGPTEAGRVDGLALAGGSLWVGGSFTRFAADQERPFLPRLDPVTGAVGPAVPAPGWKVSELYAADGRVDLGGTFATVGGQERRRIVTRDAATGDLAVASVHVTTVNGSSRRSVTRWVCDSRCGGSILEVTRPTARSSLRTASRTRSTRWSRTELEAPGSAASSGTSAPRVVQRVSRGSAPTEASTPTRRGSATRTTSSRSRPPAARSRGRLVLGDRRRRARPRRGRTGGRLGRSLAAEAPQHHIGDRRCGRRRADGGSFATMEHARAVGGTWVEERCARLERAVENGVHHRPLAAADGRVSSAHTATSRWRDAAERAASKRPPRDVVMIRDERWSFREVTKRTGRAGSGPP